MEVERVQAIVSSSLTEDNIPTEFIRPEDEQPAITTFHGPIPDIPVIDSATLIRIISSLESSSSIYHQKRKRCMLSLLVHTPLKGMEARLGKMLMVRRTGLITFSTGYGLLHVLTTSSGPKSSSLQSGERRVCARGEKVVDKLFKWLSIGLGLEAGVLKEGAGGEEIEYLMKINYYPPCPRPDLTLGVASHTDLSAMTVLVPNEVPGLQVFKDDHWIDAKYIPGALIVHIGDQIEILSNGKYKAVLHRTTVDKKKTRMSWPVFLEPPGEFVVGPLPQVVDPQNPPKYKPKNSRTIVIVNLTNYPSK
ncbi:hypothetical protein CXB51_004663 [Gossypium anomalum]|uniref:Fe2OG dioxygenase domain-containing protein n=1 Tax=Gossypium anomalum TaxID=47600 RepID=A0A8J6A173_9ROSI|nr:hypothetical protein CXB51_004663 [Gossypium anomalum]